MGDKKIWLYLAGAALLALVVKYSDAILGAAGLLASLFTPVVVGGAIAYILNILVVRLEKLPPLARPSSPLYKGRRAVSILGSLLLILLAVALVVSIVIPQLAQAFGVMLGGLKLLLEQLPLWAASLDIQTPQVEQWLAGLNLNLPDLIHKAVTYLTAGVGGALTTLASALGSIGGVAVQGVMGLIFALYLLAGKEKLAAQFTSLAQVYLPEKLRQKLWYLLAVAHDTFTRFFVGQFTEALIIGALCTLGMLVLRLPYATMIGTLVGATALLPIVGAYLGAFLGAFMICTVNPLQAAGFLVFIVVLQQVEGNLIYPRVVGSSIGLPGLWVLTAVTVGGGLGGIGGMLLAVPTAATAYKLLGRDVRKKKARRAEASGAAEPAQKPSPSPQKAPGPAREG